MRHSTIANSMFVSLVALLPAATTLAASSTLAGCSSEESAEPATEVVRSSLSRDTSPSVTDAERTQFATDEANFAVDLYHAVRQSTDHASTDVFLSPHSLSTALAMTYAGARGQTAAEMKAALHFNLPDDRLHVAFDAVDLAVTAPSTPLLESSGPLRVSIANSIWGQKGTTFESPFLDTLAVAYGAGLNVVDFRGNTSQARAAINGWVEERTEDRIKNLLTEQALTPATELVLVNAVYFKGSWRTPFSEATDGAFTTLDGSTIQVPMMHKSTEVPYVAGNGFQAMALPYDGGRERDVEMIVIAPTKGTFASFESQLTGTKVLDIVDGLQTHRVGIAMPKLTLQSTFDLVPSLKTLGMSTAFADADLSGMTGDRRLRIDGVLQKTFFAVDEEGTEAAAATAVVGGTLSIAPEDEATMTVDRPFLVAIVDRPTKTLLFFGRILQPKN